MTIPHLRIEPSEKEIQAAILRHWRTFGVPGTLVAAIPNARAFGQPGLTAGLFDLLVIAPDFGVGFIELKTKPGRLSPAQMDFREILLRAGIPHAICHGRDEPIMVLEQWGVVRRRAA
jgi:VRR-NUC domain